MATYMRLTIKCVDGDDLFIDSLRKQCITVSRGADEAVVTLVDANYIAPEEVDD